MKTLKKLEKLFDKYYSKQLEIQDASNPEYYLYMGKANAIGKSIDLIKKENETLKHKIIDAYNQGKHNANCGGYDLTAEEYFIKTYTQN
jgi:hypothetical protein